jgi:glycosyltransferase involved in cell wall biosynthesis
MYPDRHAGVLQPNDVKLTFLIPGDVLKGRVEPTISMRMCQSLGEIGLPVELVSLYTHRSENVARVHVFEHYGIADPAFRLTILPTPFGRNPPTWWSRGWTAGLNALHALDLAWLHGEPQRYGRLIFYSRSPAAIYAYWTLRRLFRTAVPPVFVLETHSLPFNPEAVAVLRRMDGVVVTTRKLARDLAEQHRIDPARIHVAYLAANAVPPAVDPREARRQLGLAPDKRYVVYTGKLNMPEIRLMLDAAGLVAAQRADVEFLFAGGNPDALAEVAREVDARGLHNARFVGFVPPSAVGLYQIAADALLAYYVSTIPTIGYMTPSKIFDYLQAGRPLVISDFPILHEVLADGRNAVLVAPESPSALAEGILRVLGDAELSARLARQASDDGRQYSWDARARGIWGFLQSVMAMQGSGANE